jgi:hypothetical protein
MTCVSMDPKLSLADFNSQHIVLKDGIALSDPNFTVTEKLRKAATVQRIYTEATDCLQFDKVLIVPVDHQFILNPKSAPNGYFVRAINPNKFKRVYQAMGNIKAADEDIKAADDRIDASIEKSLQILERRKYLLLKLKEIREAKKQQAQKLDGPNAKTQAPPVATHPSATTAQSSMASATYSKDTK